jgi:hypothetical protein
VPGQVQGLGWRLVRTGVGLAYLGFILFFVAFLLFVAAGGLMALSVYLTASAGGQANAGVWACVIIGSILAIAGGLVWMLASLLGFIGQLLSCAVPQGVASRLCIWGSVAALLAGIVAGGIGGAVGGAGAGGKPVVTVTGPGGEMPMPAPEQGGDHMQAVNRVVAQVLPYVLASAAFLGVSIGAWLLSELLWLLFLRQVGWLLGNRRLAGGVVIYVVFLIVWPLLLSCAGGITGLVVWLAKIDNPVALMWLTGVPAGLVFLLLLVNVLWYFILLRRTAVTLKRAVATA